jgi:hypothetical protein
MEGSARVPWTTSGVGAYASAGTAAGVGNVVGGRVVGGETVEVGVLATAVAGVVAAVVDGDARVSSSSVSVHPPVTTAPTSSSPTAAGTRGNRRGTGAMASLYHRRDRIA